MEPADWATRRGDATGLGAAEEEAAAARRQRLEGAEAALAEARRGVGEASELLSEGARRVAATVDVVGHGRLSIVVGEQREVIARAAAGFDDEADGFLRGAFDRVRRAEEGLAGGGERRERPQV